MSVSDVVEVVESNTAKEGFYFCDSIGFKEIPFQPELTKSALPRTIDVVLVEELSNEENEDEWVFPLEGDSADLDDIVRTVFVLNLDSKLLCKEDCKGLCHRCGKNLNDGPCNCQKELDPRFAALKQLLEK